MSLGTGIALAAMWLAIGAICIFYNRFNDSDNQLSPFGIILVLLLGVLCTGKF